MTTTRHISGSLLPSSNRHILTPIIAPFGTLQVRPLVEIDAHGLFITTDQGETLLATHGNGFSCHVLAERMVAGDENRVRAQAQYIQDCGGTSRQHDHIVSYMKVEKEG